MSPYEQRVWTQLQHELNRRANGRGIVPSRLKRAFDAGAHEVENAWNRVPGNESVEGALVAAMTGLKDLTLDPAMHSVRLSLVLSAFERSGHQMDRLSDARLLDLEAVDQVKPRLGYRYSAGAAVEGAGAGLVISGGEALIAVGSVFSAGATAAPGAGTVIGAMAVDAATLIAVTGRVTAHIAAYYGYDTNTPEEELFALSAINFGSAGVGGAKVVAFSQLSRVTQLLARRAASKVLSEHMLVKVVERVFALLGVRLTQRKLGQAVPVLGIAIGAGLNFTYVQVIARDVELAYRARFLSEKYQLDPLILLGTSSPVIDEADSRNAIDIDELIEEERSHEPPSDHSR